MERSSSNQHLENLAIEAFSSDGFLVLNKKLVESIGIIPTALISLYIDKFKYFKTKNPENNGWFYLTHHSIMKQLKLAEFTVRKNKAILQNELGIIQTKMIGVPAKEYIKINFSTLIQCINIEIDTVGIALTKTGGLSLTKTGGISINNKVNNNKVNFLQFFNKTFQSNEDFKTAIDEFITHRKQKGKKLTELSCQKLAKKLSVFSIPICIKAIETSIENDWTGIFPESIQERKTKPNFKPSQFKAPFKEISGRRYWLNEDDGEYYQRGSGEKYVE